jgi:hypothetical protein
LKVQERGRFEADMTLYLEDNGIREVSLTVRGVGVAPGGTSDAIEKQSRR